VTIVVCSIDSVHLTIHQPSAQGGLIHRDSCIDVSPFRLCLPKSLNQRLDAVGGTPQRALFLSATGHVLCFVNGRTVPQKAKNPLVLSSPHRGVTTISDRGPLRARELRPKGFNLMVYLAATLDAASISQLYAIWSFNPIRPYPPPDQLNNCFCMRRIPCGFPFFSGHVRALVDHHVAPVAQASAVNIACLHPSRFAVLRLIAVRSTHCAIVNTAMLARDGAICLHQLLAAHVLKLFPTIHASPLFCKSVRPRIVQPLRPKTPSNRKIFSCPSC